MKDRALARQPSHELTLCVHHFDSLDWLPVLNEQRQVTGDIVVLTPTPVVGE